MPESDKPKSFKFTHGGKTYTLPPAMDSNPRIPGGVVQDLVMSPDSERAYLRFQVEALAASTASDAAKAALREMSAQDMWKVLDDWLGESQSSSQ